MTNDLTIREHLNSNAFKSALAEVLPQHVTPDRMARVALTALQRTPDLAKCEQASFFKCMMDLSQWGLEPDGRRAHLIPFRNNKRGVIECHLIIDYKGLVELAYRSGHVEKIHADVVHEGDLFEYDMGEVKHHVPHFLRTDAARPEKVGELIAAYCFVQLKDGVSKTEVMSKDEVETIRRRSRAGKSGPWQTDFKEMAKKTAFRRCSKWIPLSADLHDAMDRDEDRIAFTPIVAQQMPRITAESFQESIAETQRDEAEHQRCLEWDQLILDAQTPNDVAEVLAKIDDADDLSQTSKDELADTAAERVKELASAQV